MNEQYGNSGYNRVGDYGNPYDQRDQREGDRYNNFAQGPYDAQADMELQNVNAILDECRDVDRALDDLDGQLANLERVFKQVLARPDMPSGEINSLSSQIMTGYRGLVSRVKNIKSKRESGSPRNAPQVGKVDRRLKATIQRYQTLESEFRRDSQAAAERQYRIVRPDATDAEVREAVADPDAPIFQQALLSSDRRGQASSTLRNVKERHEAIQNIERQMVELAQLFQDLDQIVQQQEPLVADIEMKGEAVRDDVTKGNEEIGTAIVSARSRNRKKWWCLLICIIIIIIIAVVVAVVVTMNNKKPAA
ncbi:t-SNARE [Paraphoma chrysanthemicola]|uniref:t-SNARE n=1 Tax=Paraphoma chrysanthemicola TaxID=798071 RepID=A0A8K0VUT3_9PLEO|nr:t-SNARE [Paraphoma chrysanthemicola]